MNIYEFCEKYKISLTKARRMDRDKVLRLDGGENKAAAEMRHYLGRGQALPAAHLVALVEEPSILLDLGRYAERADAQLSELGPNVKDEAAPREIVAYIEGAAKNDPDAVDTLLGWLMEILPSKPVPHSFIAVRLLLGLAPSIRGYDVPRIPRALLNCRKREEFADWWRTEKTPSRNVTLYQRPSGKKKVATFDL